MGPIARDYYLDRHYMLEYSPCLLEQVNHLIDASLMDQFRYETEAWTLERRQIKEINLVVRPCTSDAADAFQYASDPYHLKQLREAGVEIRGYLDIGAGIGGASGWVKSLWPKCRALAYEACPDRLRILRINAQKLKHVTCVCAAVTDDRAAQVRVNDLCRDEHCAHASSSATISAISLEKAAAGLTNIDLLRIGSAQFLPEILQLLQRASLASGFRWICGRLPSSGAAAQVIAQLSQKYRIQSWPAAAGEFFLAERRSSRTYEQSG